MGRQATLRTTRRRLRAEVKNGRMVVSFANDAYREAKGRSMERKGKCAKPKRGRAYFTEEK